MKKLGILLLAAPVAYLLLTGYLLAKIRPLPIMRIPATSGEGEPAMERLAA